MRIKRREGETQLTDEEVILRRERIARAREFLSGYQVCLDMLHLRRYERKRAHRFPLECACDDIFAGNEAYWRARMNDVSALLNAMKNSREKVVLYYHYVRGESIERIADYLDVSRRTGYRIHERGLYSAALILERMKR